CAAECAVGSSEPRGAGWDSTPSSGTCAALVRQWAQGYGGGSPCVRAYVSVLERCPQCGSCPFSAAGRGWGVGRWGRGAAGRGTRSWCSS
ncbi:unnamed protein product, partial [Prorocentrum cordatum]